MKLRIVEKDFKTTFKIRNLPDSQLKLVKICITINSRQNKIYNYKDYK